MSHPNDAWCCRRLGSCQAATRGTLHGPCHNPHGPCRRQTTPRAVAPVPRPLLFLLPTYHLVSPTRPIYHHFQRTPHSARITPPCALFQSLLLLSVPTPYRDHHFTSPSPLLFLFPLTSRSLSTNSVPSASPSSPPLTLPVANPRFTRSVSTLTRPVSSPSHGPYQHLHGPCHSRSQVTRPVS